MALVEYNDYSAWVVCRADQFSGGSSEAMARLEFFAKWRAVASLDPPYAFPKFNN